MKQLIYSYVVQIPPMRKIETDVVCLVSRHIPTRLRLSFGSKILKNDWLHLKICDMDNYGINNLKRLGTRLKNGHLKKKRLQITSIKIFKN
ncbi:hypothetical protein PsorP6_000855 [Peronosclerospora sorghi]|uniref:Uncharacterized protein n=1 Tax=Peronosclerospora sorghi TaxID=230839 RepID=A0ACC0WVH2_9STRA|nr:hypothetical protein PsorP6_000855 [Peronosclerospora sorghi]